MRAPTVSKPLIQPRVQGRNPARFKGGYGVPRGFKGGSKPSAPCGRLSEAEHPKRKGATLLRPLSAVNRNRPGNSHSRASAPCDFRFPPCFFPALWAHGFNPPNPLSPAERRSPIKNTNLGNSRNSCFLSPLILNPAQGSPPPRPPPARAYTCIPYSAKHSAARRQSPRTFDR